MATTLPRTSVCFVILVLSNLAIDVRGEDVIQQQPPSLNIMSTIPGQHLLRGSSEIAPDNSTKHINQETKAEDEIETKHADNDTLVAESKSDSGNPKDTKPVDLESNQITTTENTMADAMLVNKINSDDEIANTHTHRANESADNLTKPDDRMRATDYVDDVTTSAGPVEAYTETAAATDGDSETASVTDIMTNVYKHADVLADQDYVIDDASNRSNHIEADHAVKHTDKMELTTAPTSTEAVMLPHVASRLADLFDDISHNVQRNPKTEQQQHDTKPPMDMRNFDLPRAQPAAMATRSSTLKTWLEDPWLRAPAAILLPLRPLALTRALAVWADVIEHEGLNISDLILVGYDANGINWRSRHSLHSNSGGYKAVSEAISKLLLKYQGMKESSGDATMKALASAAKLVPYDSALFVMTDKGAVDSQRVPIALRVLVEKRLKVYTVWTDPLYPSKESQHQLEDLKKVSQHTEGDVLAYSMQVTDPDAIITYAAELRQWDLKLPPRTARLNLQYNQKLETLLVRRGGGDAGSHGIPVENGVASLRVYIEGAVEHAVLYPPSGPQIDLFNETSVKAFSKESRTDSLVPRDVYLSFPGSIPDNILSVLPASKSNPNESPQPTVGLWHLSVHCDTCDYRLTVSAEAKISLEAIISGRGTSHEMVHLRVRGPVATVRDSTLVDEHGTEVGKLPFSYEPTSAGDSAQHQAAAAQETEDRDIVADVPLPRHKSDKIYVKIVGRDIHGDTFMRLAGPLSTHAEIRISRSASVVFPEPSQELELVEDDQKEKLYADGLVSYARNETVILPNRANSQISNQRGTLLSAVQIGLSTRMYGAPGDNIQLHFEVTNYRDQAVRLRFGAVGELRFLQSIDPKSQRIPAGQTINVIVNVRISTNAVPGARDLITFTAYGYEQVSISSYVYVTNPNTVVSDVWAPTLSHNFQGTCLGRTGDDCALHSWSATFTARDGSGGLLRLSSSPVGLIYESNFIAGTREEVIATYRSTCCAPRMMITAIDAYGNANSYVVDISSYFTEAAIAAIVLGVLLLIALIALTVFLIYWCVKRRKESRELPYATSSRTTRRELS